MSEPVILFLTETPDGTAKVCAMQVPGADPVVLTVEIGDALNAAKLTREQAVGLALGLLAVNVAELVKFAERIPEQVAAELGVALLSAPAAAALLRNAANGPEAS